jgi:hypothetical protein
MEGVTSKSRGEGLAKVSDLGDVSEDCRWASGGGSGTEGGEELACVSGSKSSSRDEGREGPGTGLWDGCCL